MKHTNEQYEQFFKVVTRKQKYEVVLSSDRTGDDIGSDLIRSANYPI